MNDAVIYLSIPAQTIHAANMGEDEFFQEVKDGLHGSIPPGAVIDGVEILQPAMRSSEPVQMGHAQP